MVRQFFAGLAVASAFTVAAQAETSELRITKQPSIIYLPLVFADFMFKTGLIKVKPASWKDFFFPVVHNLPGT